MVDSGEGIILEPGGEALIDMAGNAMIYRLGADPCCPGARPCDMCSGKVPHFYRVTASLAPCPCACFRTSPEVACSDTYSRLLKVQPLEGSWILEQTADPCAYGAVSTQYHGFAEMQGCDDDCEPIGEPVFHGFRWTLQWTASSAILRLFCYYSGLWAWGSWIDGAAPWACASGVTFPGPSDEWCSPGSFAYSKFFTGPATVAPVWSW